MPKQSNGPLVRIWLACLLFFFWAGLLAAQELKFANLGDLRLASGETLKDSRVGYRTLGQLNASKNNAILFPTWFNGKSEQIVLLC